MKTKIGVNVIPKRSAILVQTGAKHDHQTLKILRNDTYRLS